MKMRYMLLKDTPELKKGAIVEEECDNGDQSFVVINSGWNQKDHMNYMCKYDRNVVMEQPEWFTRVDLLWLTEQQIAKVKKLLKI